MAVYRQTNWSPRWLSLTAGFCLLLFWRWQRDDATTANFEFSSLNQIWLPSDASHRPREVVCNRDSGSCFAVVDVTADHNRHRMLVAQNGNNHLVLTLTPLVESTNHDEEQRVDTHNLHPYTATMVLAPLLTGIVDQYSSATRIMLVGLGGASIPNFLAELSDPPMLLTVELDPAMQLLAERWFGYRVDDRNRIHIGDGVDLIKRISEQFHAILLDANLNGLDHEFVSPVPSFMEPDFIRATHARLQPDGALVVNVFLGNAKTSKSLGIIVAKFSAVFRFCQILRALYNYVMVCSDHAGLDRGSELIERQFKSLPTELMGLLPVAPAVVNVKLGG